MTTKASKDPILDPPVWSNIYYRKIRLREAIEDVAERYLSNEKSLTLVDYGCGTKPYEPLFRPYISSYIGLDIEKGEHVDRILSDDGTCDLPDDTADVILSSQVLEHVPDPARYLNEAYRLLKEDGILFLSTHGHMIYHPVPQDYWRWTYEGLHKIISQPGFTVEEINGIIGTAATGGQFILDSVRHSIPNRLKAPFNLIMQGVISFLDRDVFNPNRDHDASIFLSVSKK